MGGYWPVFRISYGAGGGASARPSRIWARDCPLALHSSEVMVGGCLDVGQTSASSGSSVFRLAFHPLFFHQDPSVSSSPYYYDFTTVRRCVGGRFWWLGDVPDEETWRRLFKLVSGCGWTNDASVCASGLGAYLPRRTAKKTKQKKTKKNKKNKKTKKDRPSRSRLRRIEKTHGGPISLSSGQGCRPETNYVGLRMSHVPSDVGAKPD